MKCPICGEWMEIIDDDDSDDESMLLSYQCMNCGEYDYTVR